MNKRFRYLVSSLVSAAGFGLFIALPYESRYFGLMAGIVLVMFCIWFGLGILFEGSFNLRLMSVLLPVMFFTGYGMFGALLADNWLAIILMTLVYGGVMYAMFLVENVFLVAIGFKTVPLYRAAYTVSLILLLISSFFMYDTLFSFRTTYWVNFLVSFVLACGIFMYQFWAVSIELADDGQELSLKSYVLVPALLIAELTLVLSFWPTGIFKGSVYLVSAIYIFCGLVQADIRDRLFDKTKVVFLWISVAVISAILMVTKWS
jgi:hypothetical protein